MARLFITVKMGIGSRMKTRTHVLTAACSRDDIKPTVQYLLQLDNRRPGWPKELGAATSEGD